MVSPTRVLHVEDDPDFASLAADLIERADDRIDVRTEHHPEDALERLERDSIDCVVSDYDLPGMDGVELLAEIRADDPDLPFVLFTGKGSEEVASEAISAGATDYLQKEGGTDQYEILANRVVNAVEQRESRTSYREIFEKAADGIFLHDPEDGSVNDVNPRAAEMLGYERDDLVEMDVGEFSADRPAFSQSEAEKRVRAAVEEGPQTFEWLFQASDGTEFWIEVHLKLAVINGRDQVIAMTRDISERKERERRLREQKQQVKALHEVAADIEASETADDVYDHVLAAAEEILNFDRGIVDTVEDGHLVPVSIPDGISPDEYHESTPIDAEDSLAAEAYRNEESILVDDVLDRDVDPAEASYRSAITVPIVGYGMFQAVSESPEEFDETDLELTELLVKHARETLSRLEREDELRAYATELERQNERLDEFASVVSHDLRSPLNVAAGRVELARSQHDSDQLETAADALDRMDQIVEHTLSLAREGKSVGDTKEVDLASMAEQSWRVLETDDATLNVESNTTVEADPERFQHLLENLLRNAVEHGSTSNQNAQRSDDAVEHGSTSPASHAQQDAVEHGDDTATTVTVGATEDGFFVADDGEGIPAENRETVFEPGYTTSEDGTGFGLAIVEEIVDAHRGTITVTESESGGARFEVENFDVA